MEKKELVRQIRKHYKEAVRLRKLEVKREKKIFDFLFGSNQ